MIDKRSWTVFTFGEIVKNVSQSSKDPLAEGLSRFVGLEHLNSKSFTISKWGNVADGTTFTRKFEKQDVLFGKRRSYQKKAAAVDFEGICSGDILVFRANEKILYPALLPYIVQNDNFFDYAVTTSAGSLSPRTKFVDLAKQNIYLPDMAEQQKLAKALDSLLNVYLARKKLLSKILLLRRSIMNEIFTQNLGKTAKLNELPLSFQNGLWEGKSEERTTAQVVRNTEFGLYGQANFSNAKTLEVDIRQLKSRLLKPGDIVIEMSGGGPSQPVGRVIYVKESHNNMSYSNFTKRIRLENNKVLMSEYLFYCLLYIYESGQTTRLQKQTTGIRNLDMDLYGLTKIPIYPLAKQEHIVERIREVENSRVLTENLMDQDLDLLRELSSSMFGSEYEF